MRLYTVVLWRLLFASRNVHPVYAGDLHRRVPGWRQFVSVVGVLVVIPVVFALWVFAPLLVALVGLGVLNRTRANVYRFVRLGTDELVGSTALGVGGAYWWCFAAAFHRDRNTRNAWRGLLLAWTLATFGGVLLLASIIGGVVASPPTGQDAVIGALTALGVVTGLGLVVAQLFLSVLVGGLVGIRSALGGVNMGSRVVGVLAYGGLHLLLYYAVGALVGGALVVMQGALWWWLLLGPLYTLLYLAVYEGVVRLLWRGIHRKTGLTFAHIAASNATASPRYRGRG